MDWQLEGLLLIRTLVAAMLGALVGWERERRGTEAGIRTHIIVCVGACTFALVSNHIPGAEPARIASQIVVGIGFLGAGVIINQRGAVSGLTTAAAIWATAAVGVAIAFGMYLLAIATAVIIFGTLALKRLPQWRRVTARAAADSPSKSQESQPPREK